MPTNTMTFSLTILLMLFPFYANAQASYAERDAIQYAKSVDVAKLDATLSSQRLEDWLRLGPPHLDRVNWQLSTHCDQKAVRNDVPYSELPLCVKIFYERDDIKGWSMITVGTIGKGPVGPPHLQNVWVEPSKTEDEGGGDTYISDMSIRLSDLPLLLDEVSYTVHNGGAIRYAKALDVAKLDPTLSSQRLDDWLHSGPAHANKLVWGVRFDCDARLEKSSMPGNESPLCVAVVFGQGDIRGWATIVIGTLGKGPNGPPHLKSISVQPMSKDGGARQTSDKLSDLPQLLEKFSSLANHR